MVSANAFTEMQSGSDFTLIESKAEIQNDDCYKIHGTKAFVPFGMHNLTENRVYFVLANVEDPLKGRQLSLFLVPQKLQSNEFNHVHFNKLSNSLGLSNTPVCELVFEGSEGYLVGEVGSGLTALMSMMVENRLLVSAQALGLAEISNQFAKQYARIRVQGYNVLDDNRAQRPVTISQHEDIKRLVFKNEYTIQALRALLFEFGQHFDNINYNGANTHDSKLLVSFVAPILKVVSTDQSFDAILNSQKVMGAKGYLDEALLNTFLKDARVTQIYEGGNGIQESNFVKTRFSTATSEFGDLAFSKFIEYFKTIDNYDLGCSLVQDRMKTISVRSAQFFGEIKAQFMDNSVASKRAWLVKAHNLTRLIGCVLMFKAWAQKLHYINTLSMDQKNAYVLRATLGRHAILQLSAEIEYLISLLSSPSDDLYEHHI